MTQSKADGSFVLKVAMNGVYDLGVFKPGYGEAPPRTVSVANNNAGTADNNSTADISANNALVTTVAPLIVRIGRPDYTISGKISDSSGNALQYAHVQAKEATSYQMVHTSTDTNGNYILGVGAGLWIQVLRVRIPSCPLLAAERHSFCRAFFMLTSSGLDAKLQGSNWSLTRRNENEHAGFLQQRNDKIIR